MFVHGAPHFAVSCRRSRRKKKFRYLNLTLSPIVFIDMNIADRYRHRQTTQCFAVLAHIRIRGPFLVLDQHATHFRQSTQSKENPRCTALAERNLGYVVLECRLVMSIHLRAHHEFFLASSLLMSPSKCRTTFSLINTHPCSPQIES